MLLTKKSVKKVEAGSGSCVRRGSATSPSAVGAGGGLSQEVGSASSTHCGHEHQVANQQSSQAGITRSK